VMAPEAKQDILLAGENGFAKRVPFRQYKIQGRHGVGTTTWKPAGKPNLLDARAGGDQDRLMISTKDGVVRTVAFADVPKKSRISAGKRLTALKAKETLESIAMIEMGKVRPAVRNSKPKPKRASTTKGKAKRKKK
jgi:DNA gyrase/topoisomerase IV subunit A